MVPYLFRERFDLLPPRILTIIRWPTWPLFSPLHKWPPRSLGWPTVLVFELILIDRTRQLRIWWRNSIYSPINSHANCREITRIRCKIHLLALTRTINSHCELREIRFILTPQSASINTTIDRRRHDYRKKLDLFSDDCHMSQHRSRIHLKCT